VVVAECAGLAAEGYRDLTLLGQNVNSYRSGGLDFPALLDRVELECPGDFRLRFVTSHPKDLSDALVARFAGSRILAPHLHLPVQSGSGGGALRA
jgi:tRNA-2-methylthio-N6-dimethylallyladenosine synthase